MIGQIDRFGRVTITFESQCESLLAPDGKKYLPCTEGCGRVLLVEPNVVSAPCQPCVAKIADGDLLAPEQIELHDYVSPQPNG